MTPEEVARRRAAKAFNERLKLAANFLNNRGIAILVGGFVLPFLSEPARFGQTNALWFTVPILLHVLGQIILTAFRSED